MTTPRAQPWYVRPAVVLPLVAVLVLLTVLVTPEPATDANDRRLTTYSTRPNGARLLFELADRLGWTVVQHTSAVAPLDSQRLLAVLAPVRRLRDREVHDLLQHVRAGGALLTVATTGASAIADSLGLSASETGSLVDVDLERSCPVEGVASTLTRSGGVSSWTPAFTFTDSSSADGAGVIEATRVDTLLSVRETRDSATLHHPVMLGMQLGSGRVVIASSSLVVRNGALRVCGAGLDVVAVRALEFLTLPANTTREIVFDEYHQGFGSGAGSLPAILGEFAGTRPGRLFYQLAGAGVLLLLAMAPRSLPPRAVPPPDRRSPLEHVDALGRAYQQVGATRTATQRLVRGLRRRLDHGVGVRRSADADDAFLNNVELRHPALRPHVDVLRTALHEKISKEQWRDVSTAVETIEHTLTRT